MDNLVDDTKSAVLAREVDFDRAETKFYLVGGGIASLAAAVFLIRDGNIIGRNITILEELEKLGGSLDGAGSPRDGYVVRGGRMLESKYLCTYDLFSSIPTLDGSKTVTQEIFAFNKTMKTSSQSRLFRDGHRVDAPKFGLSEGHILALERLAIEPEAKLGRRSIEDQFEPSFFETDFWYMWCTTFAFQPGTARSSSSAICCVSHTWSAGSTDCAGSCARSTTSTTRWSAPPEMAQRPRCAIRAEHSRHRSLPARGRGRKASGTDRLTSVADVPARSRWARMTTSSSLWAR